jgi:hypothetical protein
MGTKVILTTVPKPHSTTIHRVDSPADPLAKLLARAAEAAEEPAGSWLRALLTHGESASSVDVPRRRGLDGDLLGA